MLDQQGVCAAPLRELRTKWTIVWKPTAAADAPATAESTPADGATQVAPEPGTMIETPKKHRKKTPLRELLVGRLKKEAASPRRCLRPCSTSSSNTSRTGRSRCFVDVKVLAWWRGERTQNGQRSPRWLN